MTAFGAQVKLLWLEHLRQPGYVVASVGFPTTFYLIFAVPEAGSAGAANLLLASFVGFAVLGVSFLQFAHGLAEERASAWYAYLRTLPVSAARPVLARALVTGGVAVAAAVILSGTAWATTPLELTASRWGWLAFAAAGGGACFALMGAALGSWIPVRLALPLGNLIYLPLSYAGGLWKPVEFLPAAVARISPYLPTGAYADCLRAAVEGRALPSGSVGKLVLWAALFLLTAAVGHRFRKGRNI